MSGWRAITLAWCCVLVAHCRPSRASAAAPPDPALRSQLLALEKKTASTSDLTADFEEQTFSTLLRKPITSRGTVKVKGDRTRWDTVEPRPTTMITSPDEVQIYYPSLATLEVYPVLEYLRPVMVSPIPRLAIIERSFRIERGDEGEAETLNIVLKPRQEQLSEFVSQVSVMIDEATGFANRVEMLGADGDRTVLIFKDVRFNTGLTEEEVGLIPPPETRVVRPLAGKTKAHRAEGGRPGDK